jgi:hypothetical protein
MKQILIGCAALRREKFRTGRRQSPRTGAQVGNAVLKWRAEAARHGLSIRTSGSGDGARGVAPAHSQIRQCGVMW